MVACNKCSQDKSPIEFYPRNKVCKTCYKKRVANYQKNEGKVSHNSSCKKYNLSEKGKIACKKALDNYLVNHKERKQAHWKVKKAVKSGRLTRFNHCENCYCECTPQAHHNDYTKPLEVTWLCVKCHVEWHKHNKPIYKPKPLNGFIHHNC